MRAFYKPSIPAARVICLSFALSVHPCLLICILSPPPTLPARAVACVRVELLGSCFVGQASAAKERQRQNQGPRATDQRRPSFPFHPPASCTVSHGPLVLFLCGLARAFARLSSSTGEIGTKEGGTERQRREVVERERVSRKGLFTPLEMWNSCRPPIRRIKSL